MSIVSACIFYEAGYWRWRVLDSLGNEYVDGGNFATREAAQASLEAALALLRGTAS